MARIGHELDAVKTVILAILADQQGALHRQ